MRYIRNWTYTYNAFALLVVGVVCTFTLARIAFSAPPLTQYAPGETLQPACDPGDVNCSVESTALTIGSAVGSGTATSVLFVDASGDLAEDAISFSYNDTNNQLLLGNGSVTNPSYSFVGNTDMGFYRRGSTLRYADGGLELLRIGIDGRIAVGANATGIMTANGLFHATYDADTNGQDGILVVDTYSNSGYTTSIGGRSARGTALAPSGLLADDKLTEFIAKGYHSGGDFSTSNKGVLGFYASEDFTNTDQGTYFILKNTREGTTANHNSLIIDHNGNAGFTYNSTLTSVLPNSWTSGDNTKFVVSQAGDDISDFGFFARSDSDTEGFDIWNDTSADTVFFDSLLDSPTAAISFRTRTLNAVPTTALTVLGAGNIGVGDSSPAQMFVVGSGDLFQVTSAGLTRMPDGSAAVPALSFTGDTDTGVYRSAANTLGFSTAGTAFLSLNASGVLALDPTTGLSIDLGDTSQAINIGGTQSISSTTQTMRTAATYEPTANITNLFSINNSISLNNSANTITNLIANRGAIALGATYTGTIASAVTFQARPITMAGAATVTSNELFLAENQTIGTSIYGFVGEQTAAASAWNIYMSGTAQNYFAGNVGIGDTTPDALLDVVSLVDGPVAVFQDDNNSCTVDPDLAGVTCTSDAALKTNVVDLEDSLEVIRGLRPVRYGFVTDPTDERIGFIAQDIEVKYPEIVSRDTRGYLSMNYALLTPILTKGLQELDARFRDFTDLASPDGIAQAISSFLSDTANGLQKLFVRQIFVEEICIGTTCIDEATLVELLNETGTPPQTIDTPQDETDPQESDSDVPTGDTTESDGEEPLEEDLPVDEPVPDDVPAPADDITSDLPTEDAEAPQESVE